MRTVPTVSVWAIFDKYVGVVHFFFFFLVQKCMKNWKYLYLEICLIILLYIWWKKQTIRISRLCVYIRPAHFVLHCTHCALDIGALSHAFFGCEYSKNIAASSTQTVATLCAVNLCACTCLFWQLSPLLNDAPLRKLSWSPSDRDFQFIHVREDHSLIFVPSWWLSYCFAMRSFNNNSFLGQDYKAMLYAQPSWSPWKWRSIFARESLMRICSHLLNLDRGYVRIGISKTILPLINFRRFSLCVEH